MIKIICVGKLKESYLKDAVNEYVKRISKYVKVSIIEVEDEALKEENVILSKEKDRIMKCIKREDYVITLEINGLELSSIELANYLKKLYIDGKSDIVFIIGGSYGLDKEVKERSDFSLSFSKLTFPHQLFRVLLLEQLYRSFKIMNNETYHK